VDKQALLKILKECSELASCDAEAAHERADEALLAFIDDPEVSAAFDPSGMFWYA